MPIPWKRKKDLITCPYWKKDAELFISLCILISYGKDHLPDDFRLPMDIPLAAAVIYADPFVTETNYAFIKKGESKLKTENIYIAGPGHSFL